MHQDPKILYCLCESWLGWCGGSCSCDRDLVSGYGVDAPNHGILESSGGVDGDHAKENERVTESVGDWCVERTVGRDRHGCGALCLYPCLVRGHGHDRPYLLALYHGPWLACNQDRLEGYTTAA